MALRSEDLMRLGPAARKQIMEKLANEKPAADRKETGNKYHNQKAERVTADGTVIKFDSQKEARRYDELMLLLQSGTIRDLKLQPQFTIQEAYTTPEGNHIRAIRYQADFSYYETDPAYYRRDSELLVWREVVEDVKSPATKTRVYEIKKKLLRDRRGITIREIE